MSFKLIVGNPYDYNYIALKKGKSNDYNTIVQRRAEEKKTLPSPEVAKMNPNARMIGMFLGVDNTHEWSTYYDKVWSLYQWAARKTHSSDINKQIAFLQKRLNEAPSMNGKRINDLHIAMKLTDMKDEKEKSIRKPEKPKQEVQKVEKQVAEPERSDSQPLRVSPPSQAVESSYSAIQEAKDLFGFSQQLGQVNQILKTI